MAPELKNVTRAWDGLTPPLSDWVLDAISSFGHERMTPVQANVIPLFMVSTPETNIHMKLLIDIRETKMWSSVSSGASKEDIDTVVLTHLCRGSHRVGKDSSISITYNRKAT
jgi:hypothetical protein